YDNSGYITDPPENLKFGNGILFIRGSSDLVSGSAAKGPKNVIISNNEIYNNQKNGIYLGPIDSAITIVDNRIVNNGWDAIRLDLEEHYYDGNANWNPVYDKAFDIYANYNNIFDNDTSGVKVVGIPTNGFVFGGLYNFWGAEDGPGGQGPGAGNGVSDFVNYGPWIDDEIEDYENIKTNVPTGVGLSGGEVEVTITSVPDDDNFLDVYQTGLFTDLPEVDEDLVTNLTGCIFRFKILWGVVETGNVTADLVFDYSNQIGIADPTDIVILRRDNVLDPNWEYVPETSRDDVNRTITLAGTTIYGEYVLGFKGKFWTAGNFNDNWNDPFNWFSVGVPTDNDNIIIVGGLMYYPETNSGPLARAKNIYVEPFAHITIPVGNGLTVYGDLLNNGVITALSDNTGAAATFINNGTLLGNGIFNFNRDMTGTGALGDPAGWHYISSPVNGMSCHDIFDYWINAWNESQNTWYNYSPSGIPCIAGPDNLFSTFRGYSIKRDLNYQCGAINPPTGNVVEFTGFITDVHSGAYSVDLTGSAFSGGSLDNWNLLGNPYPASIDYEYWKNNVAGGIPAEVDDAVYFWDDNALTYRSWINGVGYTQYIPAAQGFYMHVNTPGTWTVNIDNSVRTHNGANEYFKSDVNDLLVMEVSGNGYTDQAYIKFLNEASGEFEGNYDAYKLLSGVEFVPQIYTFAGSEKVSINTLPFVDMMELAFQAGKSGYYTLSVAESGIGNVILEDKIANEFVNIGDQPYNFYHSAGNEPNRFAIHFGMIYGPGNESSISVFSANGNLYINNPGSNGTAVIYDIMGQEIISTEVTHGVNIIYTGNRNGYYIVKVNTGEASETLKFLLR
ncbi:MAG: T9SS type A sorting domain-containing protein, partial [Bacteroidales bacterium]|nr:T9SS type A sorting domain-containing protein [Bacteroidales bacterium]